MPKKPDEIQGLPESFWTAYLDLCLRQWMAAETATAEEGGNHGRITIAQGPPVEGRSVDTP